ncbi:unnamed protein product, partial [Clonostachys rosea f. rosea IK726]
PPVAPDSPAGRKLEADRRARLAILAGALIPIMDPITVFAILENCYKYGEWIVVFCESCKHADQELAERARKVESVWIRMKEQAQFMERIEPVMKPELRYDFKESLKVLERKLSVANANIQAVQQHEIALGPGGKKKIFQFQRWARKGKFAWEKETLDEIITDLDDWRDRFDPTC